MKVSDGTRTRDRLDHNQELYQLSYAHHVMRGRKSSGASARHAAGGERSRVRPAARLSLGLSSGCSRRRRRSTRRAGARARLRAAPRPARPSPRAHRRAAGGRRGGCGCGRRRGSARGDGLGAAGEHLLGDVLALALRGAPAAAHREFSSVSSGPSRIVSFAWCGFHLRSPSSKTFSRDPRLDDRPELLVREVEAVEVVGELAQLDVEHGTKARMSAALAAALRLSSRLASRGAHDRDRLGVGVDQHVAAPELRGDGAERAAAGEEVQAPVARAASSA